MTALRLVKNQIFPTKIIKANSDIFTEVIHKKLNRGLEVGNFPCTMKLANIKPVYKKVIDQRKIIIDLSAYYQTYQKSLKDVLTSKCLNILKEQYLNNNAVFGKNIVRNMH